MKVVGISSSPSRNGNTATLVREALNAAKSHGAEIEEIFLPDYQLSYCQGCLKCMDLGRCPIPDELEQLREKLYVADGIIIGSPTYGLEPNALMKNFLDRIGMYSVYTSALAGKYVVGISTAGAVGAKGVAKKLTNVVGGMYESGIVTGMLGASIGWDHVQEKPGYLIKARKLGVKLAQDIKQQRKYPFQKLGDKIITRLVVWPMIKKNVVTHKEKMRAVYQVFCEKGWVKKNLVGVLMRGSDS